MVSHSRQLRCVAHEWRSVARRRTEEDDDAVEEEEEEEEEEKEEEEKPPEAGTGDSPVSPQARLTRANLLWTKPLAVTLWARYGLSPVHARARTLDQSEQL